MAVRILPVALGNGLLTSEGNFYTSQRRLVQPALQRSQIADYLDTFVSQTQSMLDEWKPGEERDILREMHSLSLNTASKTLFGLGAGDYFDRVRFALRLGQAEFVRRFTSILRLPLWIPTPSNLRLRRAVSELDRIIYDFIKIRRELPIEDCDLLTRLLRARDDAQTSGMSDKQLRDECLTLFLAGQETSALALSWCWVLLSQHPEIAREVYEEVDQVLGSDVPTLESLSRLEKIDRVLLETMRLYPPIYVIGREALIDTEVAGYTCRKGTSVLIPIWGIHRNETYFKSPDEFCPDRWKGDFYKTLPKGAYLPFSTGPRTCVGTNFAMTQMKLVIAMIAQRFEFRMTPGAVVNAFPQVTLAPSPSIPAPLIGRSNRDSMSQLQAPRTGCPFAESFI